MYLELANEVLRVADGGEVYFPCFIAEPGDVPGRLSSPPRIFLGMYRSYLRGKDGRHTGDGSWLGRGDPPRGWRSQAVGERNEGEIVQRKGGYIGLVPRAAVSLSVSSSLLFSRSDAFQTLAGAAPFCV